MNISMFAKYERARMMTIIFGVGRDLMYTCAVLNMNASYPERIDGIGLVVVVVVGVIVRQIEEVVREVVLGLVVLFYGTILVSGGKAFVAGQV